jgi:hypothetical protein
LVSIAVAVLGWNVGASAFQDCARSVANAAFVEFPHAAVHVVAHPVSIHVSGACPATHAEGIELVSVAVTVPDGDVIATAFVDVARAIAHAAFVELSHTTVDVVANAVFIGVFSAIAATFPDGVNLVFITIAVAHGNEVTSAGVNGAWAVADAACIQGANASILVVAYAVKVHVKVASTSTHPNGVFLAAKAIAFSVLDVVASTLVHRAGAVADPARVQVSNAVVVVVANAIVVHVGHATAAALAKHVQDVAIAITFAVLDFVATAFVDSTWTIAFSAFVQLAHTLIHIVADAVVVVVGDAIAPTHAQDVFDIAVAVAFAVFDFVAAAFKDSAGTVAFPAFVEFPDAVVLIVTHPIFIRVCCASPAAYTQGVELVSIAVAVTFRDICTAALVNRSWSVANAAVV